MRRTLPLIAAGLLSLLAAPAAKAKKLTSTVTVRAAAKPNAKRRREPAIRRTDRPADLRSRVGPVAA
jgi:hypothetical protein